MVLKIFRIVPLKILLPNNTIKNQSKPDWYLIRFIIIILFTLSKQPIVTEINSSIYLN